MLRLPLIFSLLGLATSRVALILHELAGHALPAALVGSNQVSWKLFWFAGGYVSFRREVPYGVGERLFIALGGIAIELVVAALALWLASRAQRHGLGRVALLGFAAVVSTHALYYLTTGAFHGYGDGWLLHRELGAARVWLVAIGCAATLACGFAATRALARELAPWLGRHRRVARFAIVVASVLVAGAVHGGLTYGELAVRGDRIYGSLMQPQSDRDAEKALARYLARERARGAAPTPAVVAQKREVLRDEHRPFPLRVALAIALGIAVLLALWSRMDGDAEAPSPSWRAIACLGAATAGTVAAIGVAGLFTG